MRYSVSKWEIFAKVIDLGEIFGKMCIRLPKGWKLHMTEVEGNSYPVMVFPGFRSPGGFLCSPFMSISAWIIDESVGWGEVEEVLSKDAFGALGEPSVNRFSSAKWGKTEFSGSYALGKVPARGYLSYYFSSGFGNRYIISVSSAVPEGYSGGLPNVDVERVFRVIGSVGID